ncbi:hypothetical protein NIES30_24545 [Phormidium tenue NIES-30]|uniref:Uncharacterized protein n=1 Tax=Phormidium tenue NIES-30 TaxID=549789 RepID=A0A1U7IY84_9CYAN|nr:hypothetical protein NIES30_24545 [Phormidium tenue NIES-30]
MITIDPATSVVEEPKIRTVDMSTRNRFIQFFILDKKFSAFCKELQIFFQLSVAHLVVDISSDDLIEQDY